MARHIYCSSCGMELKQSRKALKNKSLIVDLVSPHECDDDYLGNITDAEKPVTPFARELAEREKLVSAAKQQEREDSLISTPSYDRRDKKHLRESSSTAPRGILNQIRNQSIPTRPDKEFVDIDEDNNG